MARNTTNTFSLITNSNVSFILLAISISWEEAKQSYFHLVSFKDWAAFWLFKLPWPTPFPPTHSFLPGPLLPTRPAPFPPAHSFPPGPSCQTVRERDKTSIYILTGNSCTKKGGVCIKGRYKPCPNGFEACGRCEKGKKNKNKRCCCLLYLTPTPEPSA